MQSHLVIQERELAVSSVIPCLHFVETAPSVLRKMPWVVLIEHAVGKRGVEGKSGRRREGREWDRIVFTYMVSH